MFLVPMTRNASAFPRGLERFFDDSLFDFFGDTRESPAGVRSPSLDVSETEHSYTVKLDMPGVNKDAVKITIDGRQVSVDAEQQQDTEKKDGERVLYRERSVSRFSRSFTLPEEISQSDSKAKMDDGVLTLTLAKRARSAGSQLRVS